MTVILPAAPGELRILIPSGKLLSAGGEPLYAIEQHATLTELRTAIFSPDHDPADLSKALYRYVLQIVWDESLPYLIGLCLNPSTATHMVNDNTVDRMITRAMKKGFGAFIMLNVFAFRATEPEDMKAAADPVGPLNDAVLADWFKAARMYGWTVMAGWGNHGAFRGRSEQVVKMLEEAGVQAVCLGKCANGQPGHPLYKGYDEPFRPWP